MASVQKFVKGMKKMTKQNNTHTLTGDIYISKQQTSGKADKNEVSN